MGAVIGLWPADVGHYAPEGYRAAFGAMLTGSLARTTKRQTSEGWIGGVLKKTWWPFALVMLVAIVFAGYAAAHFPEASTFRQAVALALQ